MNFRIAVAAGALLLAGAQHGGASASGPRDSSEKAPPEQGRSAPPSRKILGIYPLPVPPGLLPFQVSLFLPRNGHFCGGTLVEERWVLTAASCVASLRSDGPPPFRVLAGATNLNSGGQVLAVERAILHPDYDEMTGANDLALVRLVADPPLRVGRAARPIPLPQAQAGGEGAVGLAFASGFRSLEDGEIDASLTMDEVAVVDSARCSQATGLSVGPDMVCVDNRMETPCLGVSGGPLFHGDPQRGFQLLGVAGWNEACLRGRHRLYARVSSHLDWIGSTMRSPDP